MQGCAIRRWFFGGTWTFASTEDPQRRVWRKQVWGKPPLSDAHGDGYGIGKGAQKRSTQVIGVITSVGKANRVESRTHTCSCVGKAKARECI